MMRKLSLLSTLALLVAGLFSACKDTFVDPSIGVFSADTTAIRAYGKAQNLALLPADLGVRYVITRANPTGKQPVKAEELEFFYTIAKLDGTLVDVARRDTAVFFQYGLNGLLPGLEIAFSKMREGEKGIFLVPSFAAFGLQGITGKLPANTPVRFDITLTRSRSEDEQIEDFISRNKLTVNDKQTSGLRIVKTTAVPTGAALVDGQSVTVKYSGRLLRADKPFDSGTIDVALGRNGVVPGFEGGIKGFRVGEKGTVVFPSALGYGVPGRRDATNSFFVIPPYAPLAFDVEIVSAK